MKVALSLTHHCNLGCVYCYSGQASKRDMTLDTAQKAVDLIADRARAGESIDLCFFGGEPFLRFDLIEQITSYIRARASRTGQSFRLSVTTNGTLLRPRVLDYLRREDVSLCVSIDGPREAHDRNRRYRDGRGSHEDVVRNLKEALQQLGHVQANAVYGPDTIDSLPETMWFLVQLGVPAIHLNLNICADWTAADHAKMRQAYMGVGERYIESYEQGNEVAVNLIDGKMVLFLNGGYSMEDRCAMGEKEWGIAPSGNVYPCERFIGEDDDPALCLGNVHSGLDVARQCDVLRRRGNRNQECATCHLSAYCMNWCGCTNYYTTGQTDLAGPALCASERAAIEAARHVFLTLSGLDNEVFLDHLTRYTHRGRHYP